MAEGFDFLLLLIGVPIILIATIAAVAALIVSAFHPRKGPSDPT
jgi:hypothetical protein